MMETMVRLVFALLFLAPLSFAGPSGHGHRGHHHYKTHRQHRRHYRTYHHRAHHGHGYYRSYRRGCTTRAGYRTRRYYHPRFHGGYSYRGYRYYRPYLAFSPIYSRLTTVLTLDDPLFDGTDGDADKDGVPQPRTKPVGSRFLSK